MKIFGYVRVSSKEQNEARQLETMRKEGIEERTYLLIRPAEKTLIGLSINY